MKGYATLIIAAALLVGVVYGGVYQTITGITAVIERAVPHT